VALSAEGLSRLRSAAGKRRDFCPRGKSLARPQKA
jgi:hypothetical protein